MVTKEQAMAASVFHYDMNGVCKNWRRNGQTQVWKTRPDNFRVPVKFGLYAYGEITQDNANHFHTSEDCGQ